MVDRRVAHLLCAQLLVWLGPAHIWSIGEPIQFVTAFGLVTKSFLIASVTCLLLLALSESAFGQSSLSASSRSSKLRRWWWRVDRIGFVHG